MNLTADDYTVKCRYIVGRWQIIVVQWRLTIVRTHPTAIKLRKCSVVEIVVDDEDVPVKVGKYIIIINAYFLPVISTMCGIHRLKLL